MRNTSKLSRRAAATAAKDEMGEKLVDGLIALLDGGRAFHDVSISDISQSAGLTRSAFYFYFANKADALEAAAARYREEMEVAASIFFGSEGPDDFYPSIDRALWEVARTWGRQRAILHAMIEASVTDPSIDAAWQDWMLSFGDAVLARIERHAETIGATVDRELARTTIRRLLWMNERNLYRLNQLGEPAAEELEDFMRGWLTIWRAVVADLLRTAGAAQYEG